MWVQCFVESIVENYIVRCSLTEWVLLVLVVETVMEREVSANMTVNGLFLAKVAVMLDFYLVFLEYSMRSPFLLHYLGLIICF